MANESDTTTSTAAENAAGPQEEPSQPAADEQPKKCTLTPLQATVELVKRGRREYLPRLRELLKTQPQVWSHVGNLARQTEREWIELIGGTDELLKESVILHAEAMRQELAGPDPQPLERLIVARIVACQIQLLYLDALEAQNDFTEGGKAADYLMKRQQQAHRQLMDATRTLAVVRKLRPAPVIDITPETTAPAAEPDRQAEHVSCDESAAKSNGHINGHHNRLNGLKLPAMAIPT